MVRRRRSRERDYGDRYGGYGGWAPYVPVAERRAEAAAQAKALQKKHGRSLEPIAIEGRKIATSFWGQAWCDNLEAYSDFANRLPRGRSYLRNGLVIDLSIASGVISALVSGSAVYRITIKIGKLPAPVWNAIQGDCARSIASLVDLLQGRFERGVMERLTRSEGGLFPKPQEIKMQCSCPDSAGLCKHLAAVLYGVGARLDRSPELLFLLRDVDHLELISQAVSAESLDRALAGAPEEQLESSDLGAMFGIELEPSAADSAVKPSKTKVSARGATSKPTPKKGGPKTAQPQADAVEKRPQRSKKLTASAATAVVPKPKSAKKPKVLVSPAAGTKKKGTPAGRNKESNAPRTSAHRKAQPARAKKQARPAQGHAAQM